MDVQLPDGRILKNVPEGTTKAQIAAKLGMTEMPSQDVTDQVPPHEGTDMGKFAAFVGGANQAVPFGRKITSALGAAGAMGMGKLQGLEMGSFGDLYDQAEANAAATSEANPWMSGLGTVAGIAGTLPLASAKVLTGVAPTQGFRGAINAIPQGLAKVGDFARGGNLAARAAKGAALAAPMGAIYGAGEAKTGEELSGAGLGAGLAAGIGAALPVAGAAIGAGVNALKPNIDDAFREVGLLAQKYNIPVSIDQLSSSRAIKTAQKVSQDLPFSGQAGYRDKQMSAFNRALLKTVGVEADKFSPAVMDKAFTNVGREFDNLGKGKTFQFGDDFLRSLDEIKSEALSIRSKDAVENFDNAVKYVLSNSDGQRNISGEKLGTLRSSINKLARKTNNLDTKEMLLDLENSLIDVMTYGDDAAKGALSSAKQKYKNLIAIEPLAAKSKGGNISPSLLANRVSNVYKRSYVRGNAGEIGDLARIGNELLPELGGSDTQSKLLYALGAASLPASGFTSLPVTGAALGANRLLQDLVNRNPKLVGKALGEITEKEIMSLKPSDAKKLLNTLNLRSSAAGGIVAANNKMKKKLSHSEYLTKPDIPTKQVLDSKSRIESVPLSKARAGQNKMEWDDFNSGKYAEPLVEGYGSKPLAVKLENGEYIIFDGNHRVTKSLNDGIESMDMHVIDARDYDPVNMGRKPSPIKMDEINSLLKELNGE